MVRAVSLVPSITETLLVWGIEPAACTRFCEQPSLRHVGGTKNPDLDAIVELAPDVVLMNDEENRIEDHDALVARGVDVHVVRVNAVADVVPAMTKLAERLGVTYDAPEMPEKQDLFVRAFVPIWRRPWMTIGHDTYGSSVIEHVGIVNVFADEHRYPELTLEEVQARKPDIVLAPSEPYPFAERHRAELERVAPVVFVDGKDLFWWGVRTAEALARLHV